MKSSSWLTNVPLAPRTTLGLGGPAQRLFDAREDEDIFWAVQDAKKVGDPIFVLGEGSNVVVADEGFEGSVISIRTRGLDVRHESDAVIVTAKAGETWDGLVAHAVSQGWAGIECLSGIPGLVGATPIQNVGAYGQEVSETITEVGVLDVGTLSSKWIAAADCGFAYRDSLFKHDPGRYVVLAVRFRLVKGPPKHATYRELAGALPENATLAQIRETVIALRRAKGMVVDVNDPDSRSVGSFFTNPIVAVEIADEIDRRASEIAPRFPARDGLVKVPAAWLIERAGIKKGTRRGAVGVSSKHTLALVHYRYGTTAELLALADEIRDTVRAKFGVMLEREPVFVK